MRGLTKHKMLKRLEAHYQGRMELGTTAAKNPFAMDPFRCNAYLPPPLIRIYLQALVLMSQPPPSPPLTTSQLAQVMGREHEVARIVQILARRTKNNPILLGEPGVGKTAIAEGLAAAIVHRSSQVDGAPLPEFLHSKRILQLDVGLLVAGGVGWWEGGRDLGRGWALVEWRQAVALILLRLLPG